MIPSLIPKPSKNTPRARILRLLRGTKRRLSRTDIAKEALDERFTLEDVEYMNRALDSLVTDGIVHETKTEEYGAPLWTYQVTESK